MRVSSAKTLKEYRRLLENSAPAFHLKGRRAIALDRLATEGLHEHLRGRTRKIDSLAELDQ
jgi:hypothetical protein